MKKATETASYGSSSSDKCNRRKSNSKVKGIFPRQGVQSIISSDVSVQWPLFYKYIFFMGVISGMDCQIESRGINKKATDYHYYVWCLYAEIWRNFFSRLSKGKYGCFWEIIFKWLIKLINVTGKLKKNTRAINSFVCKTRIFYFQGRNIYCQGSYYIFMHLSRCIRSLREMWVGMHLT